MAVTLMTFPSRASAEAIIIFGECVPGPFCGLAGHGFVMNKLPSGAVDITFTGALQFPLSNGLGFNLAGSEPVTISNLTTGYAIGSNQSIGPYGAFEIVIASSSVYSGTVRFTLMREGGYFDYADIFEKNETGYIAAANVRIFPFLGEGNATIGAAGDQILLPQVPEPATVTMLGLGLAATAWRRKMLRHRSGE